MVLGKWVAIFDWNSDQKPDLERGRKWPVVLKKLTTKCLKHLLYVLANLLSII